MRRKTVLIVDDERRMANSLRDLLEDDGYEAAVAYSGRDAVVRLQKESFHVVVTDLRMQNVDGLDVIRFVHDNHPRTLVIVITGHASTDSAIQAVHYQVFDYLRKPFEFDLFRMAIEKAFQQIETDRLREDMAAMITHDIKIPLTSIIGFASMIYNRETGELHPRAGEFAETVQANGRKILELIENFLTSCRIDSDTLKVERTPVRIEMVMHDVVEAAELEARRQDHRLILQMGDLPETFMLDEVLVYRALSNLVQNAVKYGDPNTPILVGARLVEPEETPMGKKALCLEVLNHASQLAPDQIEGVFDRYARGSTEEPTKGVGIGLYVVQAVALAHRGKAVGECLDDGRVRFALYLPLIRDERAQ